MSEKQKYICESIAEYFDIKNKYGADLIYTKQKRYITDVNKFKVSTNISHIPCDQIPDILNAFAYDYSIIIDENDDINKLSENINTRFLSTVYTIKTTKTNDYDETIIMDIDFIKDGSINVLLYFYGKQNTIKNIDIVKNYLYTRTMIYDINKIIEKDTSIQIPKYFVNNLTRFDFVTKERLWSNTFTNYVDLAFENTLPKKIVNKMVSEARNGNLQYFIKNHNPSINYNKLKYKNIVNEAMKEGHINILNFCLDNYYYICPDDIFDILYEYENIKHLQWIIKLQRKYSMESCADIFKLIYNPQLKINTTIIHKYCSYLLKYSIKYDIPHFVIYLYDNYHEKNRNNLNNKMCDYSKIFEYVCKYNADKIFKLVLEKKLYHKSDIFIVSKSHLALKQLYSEFYESKNKILPFNDIYKIMMNVCEYGNIISLKWLLELSAKLNYIDMGETNRSILWDIDVNDLTNRSIYSIIVINNNNEQTCLDFINLLHKYSYHKSYIANKFFYYAIYTCINNEKYECAKYLFDNCTHDEIDNCNGNSNSSKSNRRINDKFDISWKSKHCNMYTIVAFDYKNNLKNFLTSHKKYGIEYLKQVEKMNKNIKNAKKKSEQINSEYGNLIGMVECESYDFCRKNKINCVNFRSPSLADYVKTRVNIVIKKHIVTEYQCC